MRFRLESAAWASHLLYRDCDRIRRFMAIRRYRDPPRDATRIRFPMQFRRRRRFSISANTDERNYTHGRATFPRLPPSHFETGGGSCVDFLALVVCPVLRGLPTVPLYESRAARLTARFEFRNSSSSSSSSPRTFDESSFSSSPPPLVGEQSDRYSFATYPQHRNR